MCRNFDGSSDNWGEFYMKLFKCIDIVNCDDCVLPVKHS